MTGITAEALSYDILPALKEHGMPSGFVDQAAFKELVRRLEAAPTYADRVRLNNDLVAMQNDEIPGSSEADQALAGRMSLLMGMSLGAYLPELPRLPVPKMDGAR